MDHYKIIETSLAFIEDHIEEPLSVDLVSKKFNMSKFYFHRLFLQLWVVP